jgi:hypothetical protein
VAYRAAPQLRPHCEQRALFFLELAGFEVYLLLVRERPPGPSVPTAR